jgi:chitin synthase
MYVTLKDRNFTNMSQEDDLLFCRTMRGVFQNIAHLCTRTKSKTWGKEGWKKVCHDAYNGIDRLMKQVVICVVADGRLKINPRTRSVLAALGVYQDGVGTNVVNGKPVVSSPYTSHYIRSLQTAHLYEYTTQRKSYTFPRHIG